MFIIDFVYLGQSQLLRHREVRGGIFEPEGFDFVLDLQPLVFELELLIVILLSLQIDFLHVLCKWRFFTLVVNRGLLFIVLLKNQLSFGPFVPALLVLLDLFLLLLLFYQGHSLNLLRSDLHPLR